MDFRLETISLSSEGQVGLPQTVQDDMGWTAGTKLTVERTGDTIVLRRAKPFPPTRLDDVIGMFHKPGRPALSIEDMD